MPLDRKSKLYRVICTKCSGERYVTYAQHWNIKVGNSTGRCLKCKKWSGKGFKKGEVPWNKGLKVSGMSGKHQSEHQKSVIRKRNKDDNPSRRADVREKMRISKLGTRGPGTPNWRGGISLLHQGIRRSADYKVWRKNVLERDVYTCQLCGQRGVKLQVDHIKSFSRYPELRLDISNGRTLCEECHYFVTFGKTKPHAIHL